MEGVAERIAFARVSLGVRMERGGVVVKGTFEFIPRIVRESVPVVVTADQDNTGFAAAVGVTATHEEGIAEDTKVEAVLVVHGMVKSEGDISTPSSQTYQTSGIVGNRLFAFAAHRCCIIALLVFGQQVDELPHGRHIVIDLRDIRRVLVSSRTGRSVSVELKRLGHAAEMCGNIAGRSSPVLRAVIAEAMEHARGDVVLRVGDIQRLVGSQQSVWVLHS